MAKESIAAIAGRRLLGVLLIVLVVALVTLSVLIFDKTFTPVVLVTLKTDHTGNALILDSDVKERGIIVGSVKAVKADTAPGACTGTVSCVSVTLALQPSMTKIIPSNVSAQILPKTLFGEQYVALSIPSHPAAPIKAGAVIAQDRSKGALETEKVIGDLLPLLTAVKPAELNATLTAMATALNGRGAELGQTLVTLDKYLGAMNPHTKQLVDDLKKLGTVALEYNGVLPDVTATLNNLQTSVQTVIQKKAQLDSLLTTATSTSGIVQSFLADNEDRLIRVSDSTGKVFSLLDKYSPEFTCLLSGLNNLQQAANKTIVGHQIQLSGVLDNTNIGKYSPGQQPRLVTGYGPNCFGLPDHPTPVNSKGYFQIPAKYRCLDDGAKLTADCGPTNPAGASQEAIGSAPETAMVNVLIAGAYGTTPDKVPPIATALAAPLLRGETVNVK